MANDDIALMAHFLRRAGFGATRDEVEAYVAKGYEATVEEFLHPEDQPAWDDDRLFRDCPDLQDRTAVEPNQMYWTYRILGTKRPLEEKVALFWHSVLCDGAGKACNGRQVTLQIDMFRRHGMGSFRDILMELSRDPAMMHYLDNIENHKTSINENFGRELLELFSMGVGMDGQDNYTEDDVKACSRAFTGWRFEPPIPTDPYGPHLWNFQYDPTDHDDGEKTFLGETGRWNGEDIIDIIVRQPATARFVSRHLYNFFVADEPMVPAWKDVPPRNPEAIRALEKTYVESNYNIGEMLRVLLNSDYFKNARFKKVKSPAEVVISTLKLVGDFQSPKPGLLDMTMEMRYMGQDILNPPSVEGWRTGKDWIDSGTLVERTNFVADQLGRSHMPGIRAIIDRLLARGDISTPEGLVEGCVDLMGPLEVEEKTLGELIAHAKQGGPLARDTEEERSEFTRRAVEMLQLVSASAEYQYN